MQSVTEEEIRDLDHLQGGIRMAQFRRVHMDLLLGKSGEKN